MTARSANLFATLRASVAVHKIGSAGARDITLSVQPRLNLTLYFLPGFINKSEASRYQKTRTEKRFASDKGRPTLVTALRIVADRKSRANRNAGAAAQPSWRGIRALRAQSSFRGPAFPAQSSFQPHAGAAAIFIYELKTSFFESQFHRV